MIVCELSTAPRIFYRVMGPLFAGTFFACALGYLFIDVFRDKDVPPWMETFAFRAALAAFLLSCGWFLASQVSAVNAWIRLEGKEIRIRRFWSGRVITRALSDVVSVAPDGIRFKDGGREGLEGRAGPGLFILLSAIPGCMSGPQPSKGA